MNKIPIKLALLLGQRNIPPSRYGGSNWNRNTIITILKVHKDKYDGGLVNNNKNGIRWAVVLDKEYPEIIVNSRKKLG